MRNYSIDWKNNIYVIVKKSYLENAQKGNTWEAFEVQKLREEGHIIKNGTKYSVGAVENWIQKNQYWALALPNV